MPEHTRRDPTDSDAAASEARRMTVRRVIAATPERLYDAYLDPDELEAWLPPTGFSAEVHEFDPSEGGGFRMSFTADDPELEPYESSFHGTYTELVPGERIVHTDQFDTDDPDMTGEMTITVTFEAVDDGTEVTVVQEGLPSVVDPEDARDGWNDSLDNLTRLVETD